MKKLLLSLPILLGSASALEMPSVFSSHMVLQRNLSAPVWGWDTPGSQVTVSFAGQSKTATAGPHGKWEIKLNPLPANTQGQSMSISSNTGQNITFDDILLGDVWICSGQSNMEWHVFQCANPQEEIQNANHPLIRLFDVLGHNVSPAPQKKLSIPGSWVHCSPATVKHFSATGYYFGRELLSKTGVPVGLLGTNWGGTRIEPWTPIEGFLSQPETTQTGLSTSERLLSHKKGKAEWQQHIQDLEDYQQKLKKSLASNLPLPAKPLSPRIGHGEPTAIYNAMVAPLVGYGVRGAIWYQGESNSGEGMQYLPKLKALVEGWRKVWKQPTDFPFYFYAVKLAQFQQPNPAPAGGDGFARVRIAQDRILDLPYTGVASTIDIGNAADIHPKNKQDIGKRLSLWALRDVHGKADTIVAGPTFSAMEIKGSTAVINYAHVGSGLMIADKTGLDIPKALPAQKLEQFAICGADRKWHWADAVIVNDTVHVSSAQVPAPIAVRYAYTSNPHKHNLYNKEGLPAVPFRTDNWQP